MLGLRIPYHGTYRLVEVFRHISPHAVQETLHEQVLAFHFLGEENNELAFSVQQMENTTAYFPETLAPRLTADLMFEKLVFATDPAGRITRVLNQAEITGKWQGLRSKLAGPFAAETDGLVREPGGLEKLVRNSKYGFLLADFAGAPSEPAPALSEKQIDYFLEGHCLPLFTSSLFSTAPAEEAAYKIETVGMLNQDQFNHKSFAKWLKRKTDMYDLKVTLTADFEQRHVLDRHQKVTQAEQFLSAEVAGCYQQSRARTLALLA